jgi:hypothetical protein
MKHMSRSQRVVASQVMKALGSSTIPASNHQTLVVGTVGYVLYSLHVCVCVGASDTTTVFDDTFT